MKVTKLTAEQIPLTFPIGHAFTKEASHPGGFNEEAFSSVWTQLIDGGVGEIYAIFDSTRDVKIVGLLGAVFCAEPFSGRFSATEQFWFVAPEWRKTNAGKLLLDRFMSDARARDCKQIVMVCLDKLTPVELRKFYERNGFELVEQTFRKLI